MGWPKKIETPGRLTAFLAKTVQNTFPTVDQKTVVCFDMFLHVLHKAAVHMD